MSEILLLNNRYQLERAYSENVQKSRVVSRGNRTGNLLHKNCRFDQSKTDSKAALIEADRFNPQPRRRQGIVTESERLPPLPTRMSGFPHLNDLVLGNQHQHFLQAFWHCPVNVKIDLSALHIDRHRSRSRGANSGLDLVCLEL